MKKILSIFVLCGAIGLAGCASIKNPVSNNALGSLISAYGLADSAVIGYAGLPRCTTTKPLSATFVCHKRSVLVAAQAFDKEANDAINKAVAFQRNNPTLDASSYVQAAQDAFDAFKGFVTANGVM
jgi:hypothetical protein